MLSSYGLCRALGVGAISVAGESGGGNLAIATALKAKQEGKLSLLPNGVFALCPYIAGNWPQDETHTDMLGSSHVDNAQAPMTPLMQAVGYGIEAFEAKNPLAWPSFASVKELEGFPRTSCDLGERGGHFSRRGHPVLPEAAGGRGDGGVSAGDGDTTRG